MHNSDHLSIIAVLFIIWLFGQVSSRVWCYLRQFATRLLTLNCLENKSPPAQIPEWILSAASYVSPVRRLWHKTNRMATTVRHKCGSKALFMTSAAHLRLSVSLFFLKARNGRQDLSVQVLSSIFLPVCMHARVGERDHWNSEMRWLWLSKGTTSSKTMKSCYCQLFLHPCPKLCRTLILDLILDVECNPGMTFGRRVQ